MILAEGNLITNEIDVSNLPLDQPWSALVRFRSQERHVDFTYPFIVDDGLALENFITLGQTAGVNPNVDWRHTNCCHAYSGGDDQGIWPLGERIAGENAAAMSVAPGEWNMADSTGSTSTALLVMPQNLTMLRLDHRMNGATAVGFLDGAVLSWQIVSGPMTISELLAWSDLDT